MHVSYCPTGLNSSGVIAETDDSNESTESASGTVIYGLRALNSSGAIGGGSSTMLGNPNTCVWDPNERVRNAQSALKLMCESYALEPHLHQLLGER